MQLSTFGRQLSGRPDALPGFMRALLPIADPADVATFGMTHYDNVVRTSDAGHAVAGTVFEVTDAELAAADEYERDAAYQRIEVVLASGQQAWVYVHVGQ